MKYLIIDMDKLASIDGYESLSLKNHIGEEMILTKAETLAKFKEIWDLASEATIDYAVDISHVYTDKIENAWDEFKKEL